MSDSTHRGDIERLSREHTPALLRWARRRFDDPRDAEEVVAETLARAWRRYETFDPSRGSHRAWLFGIARTVASDQFRSGQRHRGQLDVDEVASETAILDAELDRVVELSYLRDALASLSEEHRAVIVDAFFHGQTTKQIASRTDIPAGTVKSRMYYGLRAIRSYLEEREVVQ